MTGSSLAGTAFGNLAPGRYLVLAQEGQVFAMNQLEYRNPAAVRRPGSLDHLYGDGDRRIGGRSQLGRCADGR